ncbi:MAG: RagB/SusD family nutrient uptake outer membrane protein [Chitinophagaceae bacterium]|nr:RagB/SusD family nutrient uptake outer membrane protein [Chitinophagaceae bacterium]
MKKLLAVFIIGLAALSSCQKLDILPPNILSDDQIFSSQAGIETYLAQVYRKLPIEDFTYRPAGRNAGEGGFNLHHEWEHFYHAGGACGEMVGPYGGMDIGNGFGYWPYDDIRAVNYLLETLPKYAKNYPAATVANLIGEAHFLRAYYYFALAKRYGGIPIIKNVQNYPQQSIKDLQVPRDKEEDVWNFIGDDLDSAWNTMPATNETGRADKYGAAALKSRAMLYAGSIAKYGSQNFVGGAARDQGFVGISADKAAGFYQKAIDAAKLLEGHYSLYRKVADKLTNYTDLFLDVQSPENILTRDYFSGESERMHSWDATMSPNSGMNYMTGDGLSRAYPTLELVERFGILDVTNADGTPKRYNQLADLWQGQNLEPRLLATVYFPGETLRGKLFDQRRGIYPTFNYKSADEVAKPGGDRKFASSGDHNTLYAGSNMTVIGNAGMFPSSGADNNTRTGFYVRKYINYKQTDLTKITLFSSTTHWIEFRYAEVLLNRAEADIETGQTDDALICLNDIRDRAGASPLTLANMVVDTVRNERCKELAFENHYWWDIKRWRIADVVLNNARFHGLMPYYVYDEGKYIFLKEPETFQRNYNFDKRFYYEPLPGGQLNSNPNLYPQNPNY